MITYREAQIAGSTLVDVVTPDETMGVVCGAISTRKGVRGATIDATGYDNKWFPLEDLELIGSARTVVNKYL